MVTSSFCRKIIVIMLILVLMKLFGAWDNTESTLT